MPLTLAGVTDSFLLLKRWFHGPRLLRVGREKYVPNWCEWIGDGLERSLRNVLDLAILLSPFLTYYAVVLGYATPKNVSFLVENCVKLWLTLRAARMFGRMRRKDNAYREFVELWASARDAGYIDARELLQHYDFELDANSPVHWKAPPRSDTAFYAPKLETRTNLLMKAVGYVLGRLVGRRLLYPGSLAIVNRFFADRFIEERGKAIMKNGARRSVLLSDVGNVVDTIFYDKRGRLPNGNTLVICFEGNSSYYEGGIKETPLARGHSVLAWNTPGFGGSSGTPLPDQVLSSADAVMQFAKQELRFQEHDIVLFGWSIGGFPATWLAANYKNIRALFLDATFDDVEPLARARMPWFLSSAVTYAIRTHFDLAVARQLAEYQGPLQLVRRRYEDILVTVIGDTDDECRASNRGNDLLKSVLRTRFPQLMVGLEDRVDEWLASSGSVQYARAKDISWPLGGRRVGGAISTETALQQMPLNRRATVIPALCAHFLKDINASHVSSLSSLIFDLPSPDLLTPDIALSVLELA